MWQPATVFPARAGMIPARMCDSAGTRGIPRESGDDPPAETLEGGALPYSPRERG